jgi:hypothetical protein
VEIRSPQRHKIIAEVGEILHLTQEEVERGLWKRWLHVTPQSIKDWITQYEIK